MGKKLGKVDLSYQIEASTGINSKVVLEVINAMLANIRINVKNGNTVSFRGFGAFVPKVYAPLKGYDFSSNGKKRIDVPERKVIKFVPSDSLRKYLRNDS